MPSTHPPARAFIKALWQLESKRSMEPLLALFGDHATLDTVALPSPLTGRTEIETFWREYLNHFREVATTFSHALDTPGTTVVEWHSTGVLADGRPIFYRGVTILVWAGEQIKSLRAYYDSAAFVPEFEKHLKRLPRA